MRARTLRALWSQHDAAWRHPGQLVSHWPSDSPVDPKLLRCRVQGDWWKVLEKARITLFVTREYEHLAMAMTIVKGRPFVSYMVMPHPSGLVVDRHKGFLYIASTRNPNQVVTLAPVRSLAGRADVKLGRLRETPMIPVRSQFFPGCLYVHDLALMNGELHAAAAGINAVVRLGSAGDYQRVWWPRCIEKVGAKAFQQNYLQLNSIAAGSSLSRSYVLASTDVPSRLRPGNPAFPVDRRGVVFSGATRDVMIRGLTRPHSARLHQGRVWLDNSGYGEVGFGQDGHFQPAARLAGWTRGLTFHGDIAFVGISRVIPRFRGYAPGLDVDKSHCGIVALHAKTGTVLGSILWPYGNQIFGLDWAPRSMTSGFAFSQQHEDPDAFARELFYAFSNPLKGASR